MASRHLAAMPPSMAAVLHDGTDSGENGCVAVKYNVKVPARSTRYLIFFFQMHLNLSNPVQDAQAIEDATRSDSFFAGVPGATLNKTLNWNV